MRQTSVSFYDSIKIENAFINLYLICDKKSDCLLICIPTNKKILYLIRKKINTMSKLWFRRRGILFIPVSIMGWLLAAFAVILCIYMFITIDSHSHSASDTLRPFIINAFIVFIIYSVMGLLTSREMKSNRLR
jgi:hypothetical protein